MNLRIPKEPIHVKERIRSIDQSLPKTPDIRWSPFIVWYGNQLPKYLWSEWKNELKSIGFTWQKFLKLLRYRTDNVLMWYRGNQTWESFIEETIKLIKGPLGQDIVKK